MRSYEVRRIQNRVENEEDQEKRNSSNFLKRSTHDQPQFSQAKKGETQGILHFVRVLINLIQIALLVLFVYSLPWFELIIIKARLDIYELTNCLFSSGLVCCTFFSIGSSLLSSVHAQLYGAGFITVTLAPSGLSTSQTGASFVLLCISFAPR